MTLELLIASLNVYRRMKPGFQAKIGNPLSQVPNYIICSALTRFNERITKSFRNDISGHFHQVTVEDHFPQSPGFYPADRQFFCRHDPFLIFFRQCIHEFIMICLHQAICDGKMGRAIDPNFFRVTFFNNFYKSFPLIWLLLLIPGCINTLSHLIAGNSKPFNRILLPIEY